MNLIEQLGGYECAKAEYNDPMYEDDELYTIKATGTRFFKQNLADELLEYRRQHNIFEVGDLAAYCTLPYERLFSVRYVGGDEIVIYELWDEMGAKTFTEMHPYSDIRHATDAEIKAGKRLEVNQ